MNVAKIPTHLKTALTQRGGRRGQRLRESAGARQEADSTLVAMTPTSWAVLLRGDMTSTPPQQKDSLHTASRNGTHT